MSDLLLDLSKNPTARNLIKNMGLPIPLPQDLVRASSPWGEQELAGQTVLVGAHAAGAASNAVFTTLAGAGAEAQLLGYGDVTTALVAAGEKAGQRPAVVAPHGAKGMKPNALVFDATGVATAEDLRSLYDFFHPVIRSLAKCGRVIVLGRPAAKAKTSIEAAACQALEGFTRSVAKEVGKKGSTANLLWVEAGAESRLAGPLRFFLSQRSAFISGQPLLVSKSNKSKAQDVAVQPLAGQVALVTGAARGIGEAIATRMAAEGAQVVCLDLPGDDALNEVANRIGGKALPANVTDENAPAEIAQFLKDEFGGVDIVIHNAGVTRDKTLGGMKPHLWDMVLNINLAAINRIDEALADGVMRDNGRVVCLSSIAGVAGNMGQTNYGASKAGVMGYVQAQGAALAKRGISVNAIAPGFIETRMTAAIPVGIREAGRRLSSLGQGGLPLDVAEAITFLSTPGAAGINGQVLRVCGQSLIGK